MAISVLLSFTACNAQIKNAKTESVKYTVIVVCVKQPLKKQEIRVKLSK